MFRSLYIFHIPQDEQTNQSIESIDTRTQDDIDQSTTVSIIFE